MRKKGDSKSAGGAAVLVLLIGVFILLYMILIPSADREELFNQSKTDEVTNRILEESQVLLETQPGEIIANSDGEIKHEILPISLFIREEPDVQSLATNLKVEKGIFNKKEHVLSFNVENLADVKQSSLFFYVRESKGNLKLELNGDTIYEQEIRPKKLERITLPIDKLVADENQIKLSVDSGVITSNEYSLENIEVRNNYAVQNTQEERSINLELPLDEAKLSYSLFCKTPDKITTMQIYINNKEQFRGIIPCTSVQTLEIDVDILDEGKNTILFEIDKGDYQVSNIVLNTKSDDQRGWKSTFFVSSEEFERITSERSEIILSMELSGKKRKTAEIEVNDKVITMDTEDSDFEAFLTSSVRKGTNKIEVKPTRNFRIDDLKIKIQN
jgi:hypothetical protein